MKAMLDRPEGVTKLIADPETGRVLGVGITGPGTARHKLPVRHLGADVLEKLAHHRPDDRPPKTIPSKLGNRQPEPERTPPR